MAVVLVVVAEDIITKSNGTGGYDLTYYGNKKWWVWTLKGTDSISLVDAIANFVLYLNLIPIVQPENYRKINCPCSLVD